jgi:two-component system, NarL family, response regulator NreC
MGNECIFYIKMEMAKCILIVDDSEQVRTSLRGMLEDDHAGLSVRCEEANDGRQGITKALQLKPDLIVLDLSMPIMNGLDAAYELKRLLPEVPILMYTSHAGLSLQKLASSVGIDKVIDKAAPHGLLLAIRALLTLAA